MEIKIIPFENKYAKSLSTMWSESSAGWNGSDMAFSVETIIREEEKAHVNTNVAVQGEKVVGYCNLENDKIPGAYYIGMLNVLPTMQGNKIGKRLILKALDKTMEDKVKRLDLYTWSGNTLAVPLYKKTGFLWRESTEGVHLVNYLPFLLTNDFFKPYFAKIDWYKDRSDQILVEPDGHKINNFYVYEYNWQNEQEKLTVVFEDNGKSICGFECNDFSLSLSVENMKLPLGIEHKAKVTITSKLGRKIPVKLKGLANRYVNLTQESSFLIENTQEIEIPFTLNEVDEAYGKMAQKPTIACDVEIDGQVLPLGLGVEPTYPVQLRFEDFKYLLPQGASREILFFCKNNLPRDIEIELDFSAITVIPTDKLVLKIKEGAEVKSALPILADQSWAGEYKIPISFKKSANSNQVPLDFNILVLNDPKLVEYRSLIKFVSRDRTFNLQKRNKFTHSISNHDIMVRLSQPLIGEKHINEFSESGPSHTEVVSDKNIVREEFASKLYPGIIFIRKTSFPNNEVKVVWSVWNETNEDYSEVEFSQGFTCYPMYQHCYKKGVFTHNENQNADLNAQDLTEPWILLKKDNHSSLVKFSGHDSFATIGWEWNMKKKVASLQAKTELELFSIDYYFNLFFDYQSVRRFFYNKSNFLPEINIFNLENKQGNPIYNIERDKEFNFTLEDEEMESGLVTCNNSTVKISCNDKEGKIKSLDRIGFNKHELDFYLNNTQFKEAKYFVGYREGKITHSEEAGILTVANSILEFKAQAGVHTGIFSLKYLGKEILKVSYPKPQPQAWFNPWYGGICYSDTFNGYGRLMEAEAKQEYVELLDNFNNKWQGIKLSSTYHKKDDWKDGYTLNQYYLTLPNVPLLISFAKLDLADKLLSNQHSFSYSLYTGVGNLTDYTTEAVIADKYYNKHYCGEKLNEFDSQVCKITKLNDFSFISFSADKNYETTAFNTDSLVSLSNNYNLARTKPDDKHLLFPIQFLIFTEDFPKYEELSKINQIKFFEE